MYFFSSVSSIEVDTELHESTLIFLNGQSWYSEICYWTFLIQSLQLKVRSLSIKFDSRSQPILQSKFPISLAPISPPSNYTQYCHNWLISLGGSSRMQGECLGTNGSYFPCTNIPQWIEWRNFVFSTLLHGNSSFSLCINWVGFRFEIPICGYQISPALIRWKERYDGNKVLAVQLVLTSQPKNKEKYFLM